MEFSSQVLSQPELASGDCTYTWFHGTSQAGTLGILKAGKVLRSTADSLRMPAHCHCWGFFCKAVQGVPSPAEAAACATAMFFHGKNQWKAQGTHEKPTSADTHLEQEVLRRAPVVHSCSKDKRWVIRESAAQIVCVHLLSTTAVDEEDWGNWRGESSVLPEVRHGRIF